MDALILGVAVLVAGVVFLFAMLFYAAKRAWFGQPKGEGYAPGWQVRCPVCGAVVDAGKAGLVRVKARGRERCLGWCSSCNGSRWLIVEPAVEADEPREPTR